MSVPTASPPVIDEHLELDSHHRRDNQPYISNRVSHHADFVVDRHIDYHHHAASSTDLPGLVRHCHHDDRSYFGSIESETRHPDMIADHHHPNRLAHIEPNLCDSDSLAVSTAHHRQPHGLADSIANDIGPDRLTDDVAVHIGPKPAPELGSHHHPDNLPYFGPIESGTHCHLDLISDHCHPNRLAHLEPELRGPDSLADSATHHRRPHGLADGTACRIGPDRLAAGVVRTPRARLPPPP